MGPFFTSRSAWISIFHVGMKIQTIPSKKEGAAAAAVGETTEEMEGHVLVCLAGHFLKLLMILSLLSLWKIQMPMNECWLLVFF